MLTKENNKPCIYRKEIKTKFSSSKYEYSFEPKDGYEPVSFVNELLYTDIRAYEIVGIKKKSIVIRELDAKQTGKLVQYAGGFSAYTENSSQKWELTSNPQNRIKELSLRKDGCWREIGQSQGRFHPVPEPCYYYDFNF